MGMTIQELLRKKADFIASAAKVRDTAKTEKRDMTDDEVVQVEQSLNKADETQGEIDKARKAMNIDSRLDSSISSVAKVPEPQTISKNGTVVQFVQDNYVKALDDPNKGFKTPREFIMAVMEAGQGKKENLFLKNLRVVPMAAAGSDEQGTYADPYGGYLVPIGFSPDMLKISAEADPMGALTRKIPMATPVVRIPARVDKNHTSSVSGGLTVARRMETGSPSSSRMQFEQVELNASTLTGLSYVSNELLRDSPVSFAALLADGFRDEMAGALVNERLWGNGIGEFQSAINCAAAIQVSKETGQDADTILTENLIAMRARCWHYGSAIWIANHDTLPQLMRLSLSVGAAGVPMWTANARDGNPDTLFGRPLVFSEYAATLGDVGDIVLGVWGEYLEGTYQPLQSAESIEVRFIENEKAFRFDVRNAGAVWWRSALTPKKSSTTLSPFVTLAARA